MIEYYRNKGLFHEMEYYEECKDLSHDDWLRIRTADFYKYTNPKTCINRIDHICKVIAFVRSYKGDSSAKRLINKIKRDHVEDIFEYYKNKLR